MTKLMPAEFEQPQDDLPPTNWRASEYEAWNAAGETPRSILKAAFLIVFAAGIAVGFLVALAVLP